MSTSLIQLDPKELSGLLGRSGSLASRVLRLPGLTGVPITIIGGTFFSASIVVVALEHGLLLTEGPLQTVWRRLFIETDHGSDAPTLGLFFDPAGFLMLVAAAFAPVCFAVQCREISRFVEMCDINSQYRAPVRRDQEINAATRRANKAFRYVGSWWATLISAGIAFGLTCALMKILAQDGLMAGWHQSGTARVPWSHDVYANWWANPDRAPHGWLVLAIACWWMFYILCKQLAMGLIFMLVSRHYLQLEFGVTPDLTYNSDGHWGLRPLRRFMTWTYLSSLVHITAFFAVVFIWWPFYQWTPLGLFLVVSLNATVVIYPSTVAARGAVASKCLYIEHRLATTPNALSHTDWIDRIWKIPNLPFRTRNAGSAAVIYLVFPAVVGIVGSMVK